jgi:hypothetical protein
MATTSLPRGKRCWVSEVVERSLIPHAGLLSATAAQRAPRERNDHVSNLLHAQKKPPVAQPDSSTTPFGCLVAVGGVTRVGFGQLLINPPIPAYTPRRGCGFELGSALNEPWYAGFPQFNSNLHVSLHSGFLLL